MLKSQLQEMHQKEYIMVLAKLELNIRSIDNINDFDRFDFI